MCPFAWDVWAGFFSSAWPVSITSIHSWWVWVMNLGTEVAEKVACILWAIWARRNNWVWNGKFRPASQVLRHGLGFLGEWKAANKTLASSGSNSVCRWRKPIAPSVKINIDASVFEGGRRLGHGCVVRDHHGNVLAARSVLLPGRGDAFAAEAMSCREALNWIKDQAFYNVILEMDALAVVTALNNDVEFLAPSGSILADCRHIMRCIPNLTIVFTRRSANQAAHLLAKSADSSTCWGTWIGSCPPLIRAVIASNRD